MIKRLLHTSFCILLLHLIVFFHATYTFHPHPLAADILTSSHLAGNEVVKSLDNESETQQIKIYRKVRYLLSRPVSTCAPVLIKRISFKLYPHQLIADAKELHLDKVFLPEYYAFLFRLSPF